MEAGYRALSSLQMANNEHIVNSLFSKPIFSIGYGPKVNTVTTDDITDPKYNLRYNRTVDLQTQTPTPSKYLPVDTLDVNRDPTYDTPSNPDHTNPVPKVDNIFLKVGDSLSNSDS